MPTLFELMPLIDGWDYHPYTIPLTLVTKNTLQLLLRIEKPGWLLGAAMACTDAYASLRIRIKGAGEQESSSVAYPQDFFDTGAVQSDAAGYLQLYNRPIPASTAGNYFLVLFEQGFYGGPLPYKSPIIVEGFLGLPSTQNTAFVVASAIIVEIKDMRTFKESLATYYDEVVNKKQIAGMKELTEAIETLTAKLK